MFLSHKQWIIKKSDKTERNNDCVFDKTETNKLTDFDKTERNNSSLVSFAFSECQVFFCNCPFQDFLE